MEAGNRRPETRRSWRMQSEPLLSPTADLEETVFSDIVSSKGHATGVTYSPLEGHMSGEDGPKGARLQKFLASAGVASRRKSEELISAGRVRVNGAVVTEMGAKVDPELDIVEVDGVCVEPSVQKVYVMLNKPSGYVSTAKDELGRPTILSLVGEIKERLFPVGRLDMDTEGLLILTNDGDFANLLMHPRHEIWKTYVAVARGRLTDGDLSALRHGVLLEDGPTVPAKAEVVRVNASSTDVKLSIREGRKRQVRRMLSSIGHPVERLERISYGPLELGDLPRGKWRALNEKEVKGLLKEAKR